jgi:hypothetical protein
MRAAPRDRIGLWLGAWGAVQTTSAGIAIALGGLMRDAALATQAAGTDMARAYMPVFALEAVLLVLAVAAALPLLRRGGQGAGQGGDPLPGVAQGAQAGTPAARITDRTWINVERGETT